MAVYSGFLKQKTRYLTKPTVHAVATNHGPGDVPDEPDLFGPSVDGAQDVAGFQLNVWEDREDAPHSSYGDDRISHDGQRQAPARMGLLARASQLLAQRDMIADHSRENYRPDPARPYRHATQGRRFAWWPGRMPQLSGIDGPDFLVAGKNSFDFTNPAAPDVYGAGGESNVGRYRLGLQQDDTGLYENPLGLFGQEAWLRGQLSPTVEYHQDKPSRAGGPPSANFLPDASFITDHFQFPSAFTLGSETALTDYTLANRPAGGGGEIYDDEELR